jgi:hypothetical protein
MSACAVCPACDRRWGIDSEQAACVRLYGECIVCRAARLTADEFARIAAEAHQTPPTAHPTNQRSSGTAGSAQG